MKRILVFIYAPLAAVYLFLSFIYPTDPVTVHKHHLSLAAARAASLSVAIVFIVVWIVALYGSSALKRYSLHIRQHRDGAALVLLATGVQIIAYYLPVRAVAKISLNYAAHLHPAAAPYTTAMIAYINLSFLIVGFILISQAARKLADLAEARSSLKSQHVLGLIFISLGVLYCYAAFTSKGYVSPTNWLVTTQQHMPVCLRIATVIIPNLYVWFAGLNAVREIYLYQRHVPGILYRKALGLLSAGLAAVITALILLQFVTALSPKLTRLPLSDMLVITFGLLFLLGTAFAMIAGGVRQFKKLDGA